MSEATEAQVTEEKRKHISREQRIRLENLQRREDIREIAKMPAGQRFIEIILEDAGYWSTNSTLLDTGFSPEYTLINEGKDHVAKRIIQYLEMYAPDALVAIWRRHVERVQLEMDEAERDQKRQQDKEEQAE